MNKITRRAFLKMGGGLAAVSAANGIVPQLAFAAPGSYRGDTLITVFLRGGADTLNLVVPYGEPAYYANRTTIAIPAPRAGKTGAALDLDGFFGFHPAATSLHALFKQKTLAIINAAGSPDPSRSHFEQQDYIESGTPGNPFQGSGWIGRHLQSLGITAETFTAVGLSSHTQKSLRGTIPPLGLDSLAGFRISGGTSVELALRSMYSGTDALAAASTQTLSAISLTSGITSSPYQPANGAIYPTNTFGRQMANIAQMIKANIGLAAANIDLGGWDTHSSEGGATGSFANNVATLANSLGALNTDLGNLMGQVTVVVMTEFGRRIKENASGGTDHGHGSAMIAMGGNILGGKVYGRWPGLSTASQDQGDLAVTTDFRTVLGEIVLKRLGNPRLDQVFPGFTLNPLGLAVG